MIEELRALASDVCRQHDNINTQMWRKPLLVTAKADERFDILPEIAAPNHLLPKEMLPSCRSIVVFFVPFSADIVNNNKHGKMPCRDWAYAKTATNNVLDEIGKVIERRLKDSGLKSALSPPTHNFKNKKFMAQWSHKHVAYISGLGRFGLNAQLITPLGCSGRMCSMVTEADLDDHPLVTEAELCLAKQGKDCRVCIDNCPVKALTVDGIDRKKCHQRIVAMQKKFSRMDSSHQDGDVCGKCASGTPCSISAP